MDKFFSRLMTSVHESCHTYIIAKYKASNCSIKGHQSAEQSSKRLLDRQNFSSRYF